MLQREFHWRSIYSKQLFVSSRFVYFSSSEFQYVLFIVHHPCLHQKEHRLWNFKIKRFSGNFPGDFQPTQTPWTQKRESKKTYSPNGGSKCANSMVESKKTSPTMPTKQTRISEDQSVSSWWLNQPSWKIWSSNWIISPGFGVKTKYVLKPPPRKTSNSGTLPDKYLGSTPITMANEGL